MDLTDDQKEALTAALDSFDGPEAFAEALNEQSNAHFQEIWGKGHSTATGQKKERIEELEAKVESLQGKVDEKEQELESVREEKPDLEQLRSTWEQDELEPVRSQLEELRSDLRSSKRESVQSRLVDALAEEHGVDRDFAQYYVKQESGNRMEISEDGQSVEFKRPDGQTPYGTTNGQDPAKLFAGDLAENVPGKFKTDQRKSGSGYGGEGGDNSGGGGGTKTVRSKADLQTPQERAHFIGDNGLEAYENLPDSTEQ